MYGGDAQVPDMVLLTVAVVADLLGLSHPSVVAAIRRGDLDAYRVGRVYRIPADAVDRWLERARVRAESK